MPDDQENEVDDKAAADAAAAEKATAVPQPGSVHAEAVVRLL